MKKYKWLFLKISCLIALIVVTSILPLRKMDTLFLIRDEKNDDYGDGNIKYPNYLNEYKGLFDLREFNVKDNGDYYRFNVELSKINADTDNKNGFADVLIDIFVSVDETGMTSSYKYGPAVMFDPQNPWKYKLRISPNEGYIEYIKDYGTLDMEKIECNVTCNNKTLSIDVDKNLINENLNDAKYYVFSAGHDLFGPDEYRRVIKEESEFEFSGGITSMYQPNIIDTFNKSQDKILSFFMPPNYATVYPVYAIGIQKYILKEYTYILFVAVTILIVFTEVKRKRKNEIQS